MRRGWRFKANIDIQGSWPWKKMNFDLFEKIMHSSYKFIFGWAPCLWVRLRAEWVLHPSTKSLGGFLQLLSRSEGRPRHFGGTGLKEIEMISITTSSMNSSKEKLIWTITIQRKEPRQPWVEKHHWVGQGHLPSSWPETKKLKIGPNWW